MNKNTHEINYFEEHYESEEGKRFVCTRRRSGLAGAV